jgi:hypothetical protein
MTLINWPLLKNPYNWLVIWIIAGIGVLAATAWHGGRKDNSTA